MLLSLTSGETGIGLDALKDAVATLVDLTAGSTAGQFVLGDDGVWTLDYAAIPEHSYRLEIDVPGYGMVRAEDTMPSAVSASYFLFPPLNCDSTYFFHRVVLPAGLPEEEIYVKMAGIFYQTTSIPDHLLVEGYVYDREEGAYNLCRTLCTDCPGVVGTNLRGDVYKSELLEYDGWSSKVNPLLDGVSNYIHYLKIEKTKALVQEYFTIWGSPFRELYDHKNPDYLLFYSLSENYNAYIDNATSRLQGYTDLATLFSRDSSFSNVERGLGIFASFTYESLPVYYSEVWWEEFRISPLTYGSYNSRAMPNAYEENNLFSNVCNSYSDVAGSASFHTF